MTTWDAASIKEKLAKSDAWVARAIFRMADEMGQVTLLTSPESVQLGKDDQLFFKNLREFFAEHGFFTDRHIAVARNKMRDPYVGHLVIIANR